MTDLNFINFLKLNLKIEEDEISSILKNYKRKEVKKDEFLLRANEHCNHSFFVEKGLLRQFSIDERGKEHILSFAPENWFVTDRTSSYFNQPSAYYIQALEASSLILIDENFIRLLSEKIKGFIDFNNRLLHNHIRHLQIRIDFLLGARVPQTMVASYLGITPESLSRIRKDLAHRNFKR